MCAIPKRHLQTDQSANQRFLRETSRFAVRARGRTAIAEEAAQQVGDDGCCPEGKEEEECDWVAGMLHVYVMSFVSLAFTFGGSAISLLCARPLISSKTGVRLWRTHADCSHIDCSFPCAPPLMLPPALAPPLMLPCTAPLLLFDEAAGRCASRSSCSSGAMVPFVE